MRAQILEVFGGSTGEVVACFMNTADIEGKRVVVSQQYFDRTDLRDFLYRPDPKRCGFLQKFVSVRRQRYGDAAQTNQTVQTLRVVWRRGSIRDASVEQRVHFLRMVDDGAAGGKHAVKEMRSSMALHMQSALFEKVAGATESIAEHVRVTTQGVVRIKRIVCHFKMGPKGQPWFTCASSVDIDAARMHAHGPSIANIMKRPGYARSFRGLAVADAAASPRGRVELDLRGLRTESGALGADQNAGDGGATRTPRAAEGVGDWPLSPLSARERREADRAGAPGESPRERALGASEASRPARQSSLLRALTPQGCCRLCGEAVAAGQATQIHLGEVAVVLRACGERAGAEESGEDEGALGGRDAAVRRTLERLLRDGVEAVMRDGGLQASGPCGGGVHVQGSLALSSESCGSGGATARTPRGAAGGSGSSVAGDDYVAEAEAVWERLGLAAAEEVGVAELQERLVLAASLGESSGAEGERVLLAVALADEALAGAVSLSLLARGLSRTGGAQPAARSLVETSAASLSRASLSSPANLSRSSLGSLDTPRARAADWRAHLLGSGRDGREARITRALKSDLTPADFRRLLSAAGGGGGGGDAPELLRLRVRCVEVCPACAGSVERLAQAAARGQGYWDAQLASLAEPVRLAPGAASRSTLASVSALCTPPRMRSEVEREWSRTFGPGAHRRPRPRPRPLGAHGAGRTSGGGRGERQLLPRCSATAPQRMADAVPSPRERRLLLRSAAPPSPGAPPGS